jgi:ABC-2 type transport system ATP-binding protein
MAVATSGGMTGDDRMAGLRLRGVWKSYGVTAALRDVDLTLSEGEVLAVVGANGAGKSTLVSIAAGLLRPDAGQVWVLGAAAGRRRLEVGFVPQALGIYPSVRVRDNLALFGELAGLRGHGLARRSAEVAEVMGLTGLLGRRAGSLSGGEQRRLHVALALVHRPRLLLLDEPSTSLDVDSTLALLELVGNLAADGASVCYATNQLAEVEALGRSVAILDGGRVVAHGSLASILQAHAARPAPEGVERGSLQRAFLALTGRRDAADGVQPGDLRRASA